jgi:hypothetical protein
MLGGKAHDLLTPFRAATMLRAFIDADYALKDGRSSGLES